MIILFASTLPTDMNTSHKYASDDETTEKHAACVNFRFDSLEHMEDILGSEFKDNDQPSVPST